MSDDPGLRADAADPAVTEAEQPPVLSVARPDESAPAGEMAMDRAWLVHLRESAIFKLEDLDAPLIGAFLDHLEHDRHNTVRTRNWRLAAIHSLFGYAALGHPEHAA